MQPILPNLQAQPFSTIVMGFIVKLPILGGYNTILTITDHDCTKAVILLPCRENMDLLSIAKLYLECVFPFVGLPEKVILDRNIGFTLQIFKEICDLLEVKQNISSVYHPQTDGQSEKTNQHVEMALRIFRNFHQDNWSDLLPVVQYQLNSCFSNATRQIPYETWMGFIPKAHQPLQGSSLPVVEECRSQLQEAWKLAINMMMQAQSL